MNTLRRLIVATDYLICALCAFLMVLIFLSSIIVPGMIGRWLVEYPNGLTLSMQIMVDASDLGKSRWFICYPILALVTILAWKAARQLAGKST